MKRIFISVFCATFLIVNPIVGHFDRQEEINEIQQKIDSLKGSCEVIGNSIIESKKFLLSMIDDINAKYEMSLTLSDACIFIADTITSIEMSQDVRESIFKILSFCQETQISSEIRGSAKLSMHFFPPWERHVCKLYEYSSSTTSHPMWPHQCYEPELELPPKMAVGFAIIMGGALLCVVPGGQSAGMWMMTTGIAMALEGSNCFLEKYLNLSNNIHYG